jgi:hypothetical protein
LNFTYLECLASQDKLLGDHYMKKWYVMCFLKIHSEYPGSSKTELPKNQWSNKEMGKWAFSKEEVQVAKNT